MRIAVENSESQMECRRAIVASVVIYYSVWSSIYLKHLSQNETAFDAGDLRACVNFINITFVCA